MSSRPATAPVSAAPVHPIRAARERRRLSQAQLGERIGAHPPAISKWEQGAAYPRPETAFKVARVLRIRLEDVYSSAREA